MLKQLQKNNNKGFTIIEVMIVLAIAGLIILIVLLAVPALQRNSRNTAIKNDVSAVTAAIGEFSSNNDGALPSVVAPSGSTIAIQGPAGGTLTASEGKVQSGTQVSTATAPAAEPGRIQVLFGQKCNNSTSFAVTANRRSTAVLYNIETSGGVAPRCTNA